MIWNPFEANREIEQLRKKNIDLSLSDKTCLNCIHLSNEYHNSILKNNELIEHFGVLKKEVSGILNSYQEQSKQFHKEKMELYQENERLAAKVRSVSSLSTLNSSSLDLTLDEDCKTLFAWIVKRGPISRMKMVRSNTLKTVADYNRACTVLEAAGKITVENKGRSKFHIVYAVK